jgi:hypothetical protein
MAEVALIIGNGFDIDLGLPSKYSNFADSPEFHDLARGMRDMYHEEERKNSLVSQIQRASFNSNWFDIEEEIHKYVVDHPCLDDRMIGLVRAEFDALKRALANYMKRVSEGLRNKANDTKIAYQLLVELQKCPKSINEICFNYTTPHLFLKMPTYYKNCYFTYVHGNLEKDDIVLGCDIQEHEEVNRSLSFMNKYNQLNKANHVAINILEAKEIVFFGHSVNEMDFGYFKEFFKAASAAPKPFRHLSIITFDEESERNIKDNIRNQGISVTDLYSNLRTFDFIHTKKIYANDNNEIQKWNEMMTRLLTRGTRGVKVRQ